MTHDVTSPQERPRADQSGGAARLLAMVFAGLLILASAAASGSAQAATPDITAGRSHTCALNSAGGVLCWGRSALGNGSPREQATPTPVSGLSSGVASIYAGENHTCAVTETGAAWCWGDDSYGELGDGNTPGVTGEKLLPVPVRGLDHDVRAIYGGVDYSCALTRVGAVLCWGRNDQGQLGTGDRVDRNVPTRVPSVGISGAAVTGLALGRHFTCALMVTDSELWCWGSQPWIPNPKWNHDTPQSVAKNVAGVIVSGGQLCVLSRTNQMMCFDDHTEPGKPRFVQNPAGAVVNALVAGPESLHTCELTRAGQALCWGRNSDGQLGNQSLADSPATAVQPVGLNSGVVAIGVGDAHTCAVTKAGAVYCWGSNAHGEAGVGSAGATPAGQRHLTPVQTLDVSGQGYLNLGASAAPAAAKAPAPAPSGAAVGASPAAPTVADPAAPAASTSATAAAPTSATAAAATSPPSASARSPARYSNLGDYPVGKDSAVAVSGHCLGADQTPQGRLVITCRDTQYSPTAWLVLFPPTATQRTAQEESSARHAEIEHELGLAKPTRDFPPELLSASSGAATTISHSAVYQTSLGVLDLATLTRISPEGNAFFAVYASFNSNKFTDFLPLARAQFADWHAIAADALPTLRHAQQARSNWGSIAETLAQLHNMSPQAKAEDADIAAQSTKALLPKLVGTWAGNSRATIGVYVNVMTPEAMDLIKTGLDEGPATLRINPDGSYTMHSDWTFSGCRIIRDHDGMLRVVGDPKPQGIVLQAAHYVERVEKVKSFVTCNEGTHTQAPSIQFGLIWDGTSRPKSLYLTRREDGDAPNTHHVMSFAQQGK